MTKIRTLIVDDAVIIRKILSDTISLDPALEVAGVAPNGKIALQKITQVNPDVIILDIEMPELNGIKTLKELRKEHPKLPVIMFSTHTERGAAATLEALAAGATDYVTKPATMASSGNNKDAVLEELVTKIKLLVHGEKPEQLPESSPSTVIAPRGASRLHSHPISAVVIGVSTGGPNALAELIPMLPEDLGVPVLIVQHMPAIFTKYLADRLNAQSKLRVVEAAQHEIVEENTVYIAPGNYHLELKRESDVIYTHLHQGPQENSCRPAVDVLFRSAVSLYGSELIGVILTGMGKDGLYGCTRIRESGGYIIAQDKESSVVWGMPGYVATAGLADSILPLSGIADEIVRLVQRKQATSISQTTLSSVNI